MRKIFIVAVMILMASGYAAGADYWHCGVGVKFAGVMPGKDYSNTLGGGLLVTFGNPDSRFTTQFDVDKWSKKYNKSGDTILTSAFGVIPATYKLRERHYSGLSVGIFEKFRAVDFSNAFSAYMIAGIGGYFLNFKWEESDNGTVNLKSKSQHSLGHLSGGLGLEAQFNQHVYAFIEGRYVALINAKEADKNIMNGYLGVRYVF
ncbi:MAG TPA: hypothetical protein DEO84_06940 [candidate division Zixibacteria bacterium]|nr:hypothetical protein [candidate division Zixibacteria bacterium]HBZ01040.1 hypothetical protein [candidate division Zixibacteria bacterium]